MKGAKFLINSDAHEDSHLLTPEKIRDLMKAYNISQEELERNINSFLQKINFPFTLQASRIT